MTRAEKDNVEPTKTPTTLSIDPKEGEDGSTSLKSYCKGESSRRTLEDRSTNAAQPIEPIKGFEPINLAPRRSGHVRRMIEFYQPDVDSINYMDAGEPSVSEEVIGAPNAETWLQSMKFEMDLIHHNQMWELIKITSRKAITLKMGLLIQICI